MGDSCLFRGKEPRGGVDYPTVSRAGFEKAKGRVKFHSRTGLVCPEGGVEV